MPKSRTNPKISTIQIKNKGIGSSKSLATRVIDIQNLNQLRDSFYAIYRLAVTSHESQKWITQMIGTKWYEQVGLLLQEASRLVNELMNNGCHVTILSDTEIRSAQLSALTQVLLFPECRTLEGFRELLQRQFLQWGSSGVKKEAEGDRGPGLIQFLDAVYQLTVIYPLSFQFS